jgi:hypothetical protein
MDTRQHDDLLMLFGETRHCDDCDTATVFLPVEGLTDVLASVQDEVWICTACDAAVLLPALISAA